MHTITFLLFFLLSTFVLTDAGERQKRSHKEGIEKALFHKIATKWLLHGSTFEDEQYGPETVHHTYHAPKRHYGAYLPTMKLQHHLTVIDSANSHLGARPDYQNQIYRKHPLHNVHAYFPKKKGKLRHRQEQAEHFDSNVEFHGIRIHQRENADAAQKRTDTSLLPAKTRAVHPQQSQQKQRTDLLPQQTSTTPTFSQLQGPVHELFLSTDRANTTTYEVSESTTNIRDFPQTPTLFRGTSLVKSNFHPTASYEAEKEQHGDGETKPILPSTAYRGTKSQQVISNERKTGQEMKSENTSLTTGSRTGSEALNLTKGFHHSVQEINMKNVENDSRQEIDIRTMKGNPQQPARERIMNSDTSAQQGEKWGPTSERPIPEHSTGLPRVQLSNPEKFHNQEGRTVKNPIQVENEFEVNAHAQDVEKSKLILEEKNIELPQTKLENLEKKYQPAALNDSLTTDISQGNSTERNAMNISPMIDSMSLREKEKKVIPTEFSMQESSVDVNSTSPVLEEKITAYGKNQEEKRTVTESSNTSAFRNLQEETVNDSQLTPDYDSDEEPEGEISDLGEPTSLILQSIAQHEIQGEVATTEIPIQESKEEEMRTSLPIKEEDEDRKEEGIFLERAKGGEPIHNFEYSRAGTGEENTKLQLKESTTGEEKVFTEVSSEGETSTPILEQEQENHEESTVWKSESTSSPLEDLSEGEEPIQDFDRSGSGPAVGSAEVKPEKTEEEKPGLDESNLQITAKNFNEETSTSPALEEDDKTFEGVKEGENAKSSNAAAAEEVQSEELNADEEAADREAAEAKPDFSVSEHLTPEEEFEENGDNLHEKNQFQPRSDYHQEEQEKGSNIVDFTESVNQDYEDDNVQVSRKPERYEEPTTLRTKEETAPPPLGSSESQSEDDLGKRGSRLVSSWSADNDGQTLDQGKGSFSLLPSTITTDHPHNSVRRSNQQEGEDLGATTLAPVAELMPIVPVIVHDLQSGTVSDSERKILMQVFGKRWPSIEFLARKQPINPDRVIDAQYLGEGPSKRRPERDVHYHEVLTDYLEEGDGDEYAYEDDKESDDTADVFELKGIADRHRDWRIHPYRH